jgi:hypothetical protein
MDHHTRFLALVAIAIALQIPLKMQIAENHRDDRRITDIMNAAAIGDKAEQKKVFDAAKDNTISTLPAAEVKPAEDVRQIMIHNKPHFHPKF